MSIGDVFRHHVLITAGAEETLARRFASGEIDEDDYRDRLSTLRSTETGSRPYV